MHLPTNVHPEAVPPDSRAAAAVADELLGLLDRLAPPAPPTPAAIRAMLTDAAEPLAVAKAVTDAIGQRRRQDLAVITNLTDVLKGLNAKLQATCRTCAAEVAAFTWLRRMVRDWALDELLDATADYRRRIEDAFTAWGLPLVRSFTVNITATAYVLVATDDTEQASAAARQQVRHAVASLPPVGDTAVDSDICDVEPAADGGGLRVTVRTDFAVKVIGDTPYDAAFDARRRVAATTADAVTWRDAHVTWMTDEVLPPDAETGRHGVLHPVGPWDGLTASVAEPYRPRVDMASRARVLLDAWWNAATGTTAQRIDRVAERLATLGRSAHRRDRRLLADLIAAVSRAHLELAVAEQVRELLHAEATVWQHSVRGWLIQTIAGGHLCLSAANEALSDWDMEPIRQRFTVLVDVPVSAEVAAVSPGEALLMAEATVGGDLAVLLPGVDRGDVSVLWDHADPDGGDLVTADRYLAHLWLRVPFEVAATGTGDAYRQAVAAVRERLGTVDGVRVDVDRIRPADVEQPLQGHPEPDR